MKRHLADALRRRVIQLVVDVNASSSVYHRFPELTVSDVAWLARDVSSLNLLTNSTSAAVHTLLEKKNLASRDASTGLLVRDIVIPVMSESALLEFYRAVSTVKPELRETEGLLFTLEAVSSHILDMKRHAAWSMETAVTFLKQTPTIALAKAPKTAALMADVIHSRIPHLGESARAADVKSFLQTMGSQLIRYEQSEHLSKLNFAAFSNAMRIWLDRRHAHRFLIPQTLVTFSKLYERGFPLSPLFGSFLSAYIKLFHNKQHQITLSEALRLLHCINRVRSVHYEMLYESEVQFLLDAIVSHLRQPGSLDDIDGVDLAMLVQCMSTSGQHQATTVLNKPASPPSSSTATTTNTQASNSMSIAAAISARILPALPTMSPRGFLSFCRAATQIDQRSGLERDGVMCEAVAQRVDAIIRSPQLSSEPLLEKLTFLTAGNVFYNMTPRSRGIILDLIWHLLRTHPNSVGGTEASLFFSALAWTFGVPVGCGDLAVAGRPAPAILESRAPLVRELDAVLIATLVERAAMATRLSQYSLSTMLRSFVRLGLTYHEVSPVVRRILTLRHDPASAMASEAYYGRVHERSALDDYGDLLSAPSVPAPYQHGRNKGWDERNVGTWCLFSPHMSEMVMMSLDALKCDDAAVNAYVLLALQNHNTPTPSSSDENNKENVSVSTSTLHPRLKEFVDRMMQRSPEIADMASLCL